uniref:FprA family A-type flavoprotein n=1 Tax=Prevotella sp. TaxID=59823 RepID=UPI003FF0A432
MKTEITNGIHYVGVNDRHKHIFEGLWPLPYGVSYNSYIIADEKIALVDTVEADFFTQYLDNIRSVIGDRPIDYIIVNHMEPDHSGSLTLIKKYYPNAKIVGNKKTFGMMQGFYRVGNDADGDTIEVKNGDTLQLGSHTLAFTLVPMVHWPETMVTLDTTANVLFSGDAFGCFGALNGAYIDAEMNCDIYWDEMLRYYSNIVGKYGTPVQQALKKLAGVKMDYICSTHGPVWHEHIERVVGMYDRLSRYEGADGLVIAYASMYGNTERAAEVIARAASEAGVKNIIMHDVSRTHHSYIIADTFRYRALILGAPTYNNGLYPQMESLLSELAGRGMKNRLLGWFGSFSWAGKAMKTIGEWNETRLHFEPVGTPVEIKQSLDEATTRACEELGRAMGERLL